MPMRRIFATRENKKNIMEKISIITICYNCSSELKRTLDSTIGQTYQNKEIIVVDGGSTNDTQNVLKAYRDKIDVLISEKDNGIYDALNKGIKASSGVWINCMNAGDTFADKDVLSNIFADSNVRKYSFLYSDYWGMTNDGQKLHKTTNRDTGSIVHQSTIYRKELHNKYGYYLVTHPYTVSDLLFFLSVPEKEWIKVPYEISIQAFGGVSQIGNWCSEKALALKVVFGINTLQYSYYEYLHRVIHNLIPYKFRRFVRKSLDIITFKNLK